MNRFALIALSSSLIMFALAVFVLMKGWKKKVHRAFFVFNASAAFWIFNTFILCFLRDRQLAWTWKNICYVVVAFIPPLFAHLIFVIIGEEAKQKNILKLSYVISTSFSVLSLTELFIRDIRPWLPNFNFVPVPGLLFHFFIMFFYGLVGYAHYRVWILWRMVTGHTKTQLLYVLVGFVVGFLGTVIYFLLLYGINLEIYIPHDLVTLLYSFILSYAIVRHQLLDIEVVIKRTLVFAGLVGAVVVVVSMVAFVSQDLLARFVAIPKWLSNVLAAGIIAATYGRLRNWLVEVTDRYLFQKKYDYKELLRKFSDEVAVGIRDLKQLVEMTVERLTETVKLGGCSLLLLNRDTHKYELVASKGSNGQQVALEEQEPFIAFLRQTREPIGLDGQLGKVRFPDEVGERLKQLNARLCLPLIVHEDLIGVLCLGKKKSDEEFTDDDVGILMTLVSTLAIAVSNAQLFDELSKTQAEAAQKEKLAVIGTLAAGLAHEIKNPLTAIKTFTEFLHIHFDDPEFRRKFQRIVGKEVERINYLVQQLLEFAKPTPAQMIPVNVVSLLDETLELFSNELIQRHIHVQRRYTESCIFIGDPRQLRHIFVNLILNGIQAINDSGTLTVEATQEDGKLLVRVIDTGCGIAPEDLPQVFEPFFTTKTKGSGLGLAVVKRIVEEYKGRISMESQLAKGTTMTLSLPLAALDEIPNEGQLSSSKSEQETSCVAQRAAPLS